MRFAWRVFSRLLRKLWLRVARQGSPGTGPVVPPPTPPYHPLLGSYLPPTQLVLTRGGSIRQEGGGQGERGGWGGNTLRWGGYGGVGGWF